MAVANQKGGVGKTTTAVNLGAALAEMGYRVLLVDLDPQGNATTGVGVNARNLQSSIYDVLLADLPMEDCIEPTAVRNLFVAPAMIDLAGAEIELVPAFSRELRLRRAIERMDGDFDFILIDCPPSLGLLTVNGLAAATEVVVPIQCEYYALEGLGQLMRNVQLVQRNLNPRLDLSTIILTMYDARTKLAEQVAKEVRQALRGQGVPQHRPPDGPPLRGALVRPAHHRVRLHLPGGPGLPRAGQGGKWWRAAADWVGASGRSSPPAAANGRTPPSRTCPPRPIFPNTRQPRSAFDEEAMAALTASVRELGVLQPVLVRATGEGTYELIAGERRWRAAKRAGLPLVPAIIRTVDDTSSLEQALVENLQREDLNPLDEAAAYQQLLEDFHLTHDELATRMGKSRAAISNTLRLFQLPPSVQRLVAGGQAHRRPRPGPAHLPRPRLPGDAGQAGGGRGPVGAGGGGGGPPPEPEARPTPGARPAPPAACARRACSSSRSACPTTSTPG